MNACKAQMTVIRSTESAEIHGEAMFALVHQDLR